MQGTWKTKKKYFQKDKFKQIVKTIRYLNPQEFKEPLKVDFIENYKLKQSRCPNNPMKKIIQRDWIRCESWEKKSQPISFQNLYYCRLFKSKEI